MSAMKRERLLAVCRLIMHAAIDLGLGQIISEGSAVCSSSVVQTQWSSREWVTFAFASKLYESGIRIRADTIKQNDWSGNNHSLRTRGYNRMHLPARPSKKTMLNHLKGELNGFGMIFSQPLNSYPHWLQEFLTVELIVSEVSQERKG